MKPDLTEDTLRRIWEYNIEPFVEDQLFGDQDQIDEFRFDAVLRRYRSESGIDELEDLAAASGTDGPPAELPSP